MVVKNRTLMPPISQYKAVNGTSSDWHFVHYAERTKGCASNLLRSDNMIISSGHSIAGAMAKVALLSHPAVLKCAVAGAPDEKRGMLVSADVVLAPRHIVGPDRVKTVQSHVKRAVAPLKCRHEVCFVDALPKTQTGKIKRFRL
jgi:2-aminobenzoate-CoA ligase